jgi:hypothetical protein
MLFLSTFCFSSIANKSCFEIALKLVEIGKTGCIKGAFALGELNRIHGYPFF